MRIARRVGQPFGVGMVRWWYGVLFCRIMRTAGGEDQDSAILYLRQQEPCEQIMCQMIDAESALKTLFGRSRHNFAHPLSRRFVAIHSRSSSSRWKFRANSSEDKEPR
jgi:hypothetical protein